MDTTADKTIEGSRASAEVLHSAEQLMPLLYAELRSVARRTRLSLRGVETLQTTALVNEAYLRLRRMPAFADHAHFLRAAALAMRHALINHVRDRLTAKRGGDVSLVPLDEIDVAEEGQEEYVLAVHEALERLGELDPRLEQVVECRFFGGYSMSQTAEALALHERTVHRDWARARAWLRRELGDFGVSA